MRSKYAEFKQAAIDSVRNVFLADDQLYLP